MQIEGSLSRNLEAARRSAQRLRGRQVYPETIRFWTSLLSDARSALEDNSATDVGELERLVKSVEAELAGRNPPDHVMHMGSSPEPRPAGLSA